MEYLVSYLVIRPASGRHERMGDGQFRRGILRLLLLGYLDSNQEQLMRVGLPVRQLPSPKFRVIWRKLVLPV
jgi:hypothetical protein